MRAPISWFTWIDAESRKGTVSRLAFAGVPRATCRIASLVVGVAMVICREIDGVPPGSAIRKQGETIVVRVLGVDEVPLEGLRIVVVPRGSVK